MSSVVAPSGAFHDFSMISNVCQVCLATNLASNGWAAGTWTWERSYKDPYIKGPQYFTFFLQYFYYFSIISGPQGGCASSQLDHGLENPGRGCANSRRAWSWLSGHIIGTSRMQVLKSFWPAARPKVWFSCCDQVNCGVSLPEGPGQATDLSTSWNFL